MNHARTVEEMITKFFLNTCRLHPQLTISAAQAITGCVMKVSQHPVAEKEADLIPLTTGSVAEFYIEPMLPHVGDVDTMYHWSTELAIPRGHPPPTQLPAEFHNYVRVGEIYQSHFPGYVYLQLRYLLIKCLDAGKYTVVEYDRQCFIKSRPPTAYNGNIHGPAVQKVQPIPLLPCDTVRCIRCLAWPTQAADWPTRHRNYGLSLIHI